MATRVGIGHSSKANAEDAASEAGRTALAEAGGKASLVFVFMTGKHDPRVVHACIRGIVGPRAALVGGSTMGVVTRETLSYGAYEVGVAVIDSDSFSADVFMQVGIDQDERLAGRELAKQIRSRAYEGPLNLMLFYDSVKKPPVDGPPVLNLATPLLQGMGEAMGAWPNVAGGGLMSDIHFNATYQFAGDRIEQQAAVALMLSGGITMDTAILHGCRPASGYHTVTKAAGNLLLELDGKPAAHRVAELLGGAAGASVDEYPLYLTFGVNRGEKFGEFREGDYQNRLVMAVVKETGALVMFEPDLKAGDEIQLMRRSIDFTYMKKRCEELLLQVAPRKPLFALYVDCAGRASIMCGTDKEEAAEVQKAIGSRVPLLGIYTGVEVAKVGEVPQPLDWTGVLSIFSEA